MLETIKTSVRNSSQYNKIVFVKNLRGQYFDWKHNIQTASNARLADLSISSSNIQFGAEYVAADAKAVKEVFANLDIDHKRFVFVDLGSGKGRVLFAASDYPYKKIIGVEFAQELDQTAQNNIKNYRSRNQKCTDIKSVCADAAEFEIPNEPLVFFLFNPFGQKVISEVLANIELSLKDNPRDVYILYMATFHKKVFDESKSFKTLESGDWHILYKNV
ncbi:MAG: class I SAM-dependent methyltransferase [Pyrinomonadaceae bacterium]